MSEQDERIAFIRAIPVETIRASFEKQERDLDSQRGYNERGLPPFGLNWNNTMYSSPWVREKFDSYASGYYAASWTAHQASLASNEAKIAALTKALNDLHVWCEIEECGDQAEIITDAFIAAGITEHRCANCDGLGEWDEGPLPATSSSQISPDYRHIVCSGCNGKGTVKIAESRAALSSHTEQEG